MAIETGVLATGHPFARIGSGPQGVVYLPGLSFTHEPKTPKAVARAWKAWPEPIERHGLTMVEIGRRPDLPSGSTTADIAGDYAAVIRTALDGPVGVMGISTGGGNAMWLAIRHPELVERLVLDPPALVRELVAALPDVRHVEYPRSSHLGPGRPFADDACAFLGGAT
jgi:pimeloyl-ACP methyl ester carboxylesterase